MSPGSLQLSDPSSRDEREAHAQLLGNLPVHLPVILRRAKIRVAAIIDVVEDLIRLAPELALAPSKAPRTAAWLAEWQSNGKAAW